MWKGSANWKWFGITRGIWSTLQKLYFGLRNHGSSYLTQIVSNEIVYPRFGITPMFRRAAIGVLDTSWKRPQAVDQVKMNCLQFICDLNVCPVTFDFASYLAAAEIERRRRRLEAIQVVFVPRLERGIRREKPSYATIIGEPGWEWRVRHILVAMLALLPSVESHIVCRRRDEADAVISRDPKYLYPQDYRSYLPRQPASYVVHEHARQGTSIFPMFRATDRAREFVAAFLASVAPGRKPIVITLRNYAYEPERNSRVEDWRRFATGIDGDIFAPIFVPDTETAMDRKNLDIGGHITCEAACWDLEIRMALYEAAWLNMAVMHGPMELCWFNESVRYLIFFEIGRTAVSSTEFLTEAGHPPFADLTFAKPYQRIVWEGDHLPVLEREFQAFIRFASGS
jgi:hypothetical protein